MPQPRTQVESVRQKSARDERAARIACNPTVRLFFDFKPWRLHFASQCVNVSRSGILVEIVNPDSSLEQLLAVEQTCQLQVDSEDSGFETFMVQAKLARQQNIGKHLFLAFQFESLSEDSLLELGSLLRTGTQGPQERDLH